jgi:hypothetical protein
MLATESHKTQFVQSAARGRLPRVFNESPNAAGKSRDKSVTSQAFSAQVIPRWTTKIWHSLKHSDNYMYCTTFFNIQ